MRGLGAEKGNSVESCGQMFTLAEKVFSIASAHCMAAGVIRSALMNVNQLFAEKIYSCS